jgi:PAS domain S-box-containing protein
MDGKDDQYCDTQQFINDILFDSIGDGAITTDEFGKITRINRTAEAILGITAEEAIGTWLSKEFVLYDDDNQPIPATARPLTRAFIDGGIVSEQTNYRHKDGRLVRIALTVSPLMSGNKLVGSIQIIRDISTEYEIDRMKSDFISLASHQLRTPLSSIKTYSHMLLDGYMGQLSEPQIKSLRTIVSATNRMNETVSTLLNVSRIESGKVITERKLIAINRIINTIVDDHRLAASNKDINLEIKHAPEGPKVYSDAVVLKEILGNLLSNAIKYTPPSGIITISGRIPKKRHELVISISDTGFGIPAASFPKIFSKFYRADNVVSREAPGIGLGLYLVKGLIDELGGKVWFRSQEGKGSTFYIALPIRHQTRSNEKPNSRTDRSQGKVKKVTAKLSKGMA